MSRSMSILLVVLLIPIVLVVLYFVFANNQLSLKTIYEGAAGKSTVVIGHVPISVDVADTEAEREQGLGGRMTLAPNDGMLFVFDHDGVYGIWMKGMHFPIDIIWIDSSLHVIDIKQNVQPDTYPQTFYPKANARYVLEVNALFVEAQSIHIGDKVRLPLSIPQPVL